MKSNELFPLSAAAKPEKYASFASREIDCVCFTLRGELDELPTSVAANAAPALVPTTTPRSEYPSPLRSPTESVPIVFAFEILTRPDGFVPKAFVDAPRK